ncbi:predicted protein [Botrytis cinerea T4]|uniref:Uncharacterized protein n=1 Tax=Botryotinia fuckeliana (strain T4) TaxID=999810 RepID=G2Y8C6_BOTF4|nr:predicted protein [Botrytis cinerea T4]
MPKDINIANFVRQSHPTPTTPPVPAPPKISYCAPRRCLAQCLMIIYIKNHTSTIK